MLSPLQCRRSPRSWIGLILVPVVLISVLQIQFGYVTAAPQAATGAAVALSVPEPVMIGSTLDFIVRFDNNGDLATDAGYGPYVDLFLPLGGFDGTSLGGPNDGISFVGANYLGAGLTSNLQVCAPAATLAHALTGLPLICPDAPPGVDASFAWQFVTLTLPFGSFAMEQPPIEVSVAAQLSNLADVGPGAELPIHAAGGFRFGADPLDNPGADPAILADRTTANVTPALISLTKQYSGPEAETATGPNFLRRYTIDVDLAANQVVNNLDVTDLLPANLQFVRLISTLPAGAPCTLPATTTPGGSLICAFASLTGSESAVDAQVVFEFYVPEHDAALQQVLDPNSGDDVFSDNQAAALGDWVPLDLRDAMTVDNAAAGGLEAPQEHRLTDKAIAIQKSVRNLTDGSNSPGDVLEYSLRFQVSDYFVLENLEIVDILSDGQHFDSSFSPTLAVSGRGFDLSVQNFDSTRFVVDESETGNDPNPATNGSTSLTFQVSAELDGRGVAGGQLLGGCIPPGGGDADCEASNDGPTTAEVVYRAVIQDYFTDTYPSSDPSVDQGDFLENHVTVSGYVLENQTLLPTGQTEDDTSHAQARIAMGSLSKSIYAVNGVGCGGPCPAVQAAPGDTLTYRLQYILPNSDFEDLILEDFLPMPVFDVDTVAAFNPTVCGIPDAGVACYGPNDSYHNLTGPSAIIPTFSQNTASNSIRFTYGDYDHPSTPASAIDLLFTVRVLDDPFADGLFLTNQVRAHEGSTNAGSQVADSIVQFQLQEPVVNLYKGVVATDNPSAVYNPSPPLPADINFTPPGSGCPRLTSGTVGSEDLPATFNSDLSNVDAGDRVTFAIVIANTGRGAAFDVRLRDAIPTGYQIPAGGANLCITDGTGQAIGSNDLGGGLFSSGIELIDPGPTPGGALDPGLDSSGTAVTTGRNVAIITYDLQLAADTAPRRTITNTASLLHYAGVEGGADHIQTDLTDNARIVTGVPSGTKSVDATDQAHTSGNHVAIGEIVDYTLSLRIPEGVMNSAMVVDNMDAGLALVSCTEVSADAGITTNLSGNFAAACNPPTNPAVANTGARLTFTLGDLTNTNTDNATAEYIHIRYRVIVTNVTDNTRSGQRNNSAVLSWNNGSVQSIGAISASNVTIVEPGLRVVKTAAPTSGDAGDEVMFTFTLSHNASSNAPAFEVTLADAVPADTTLVPGSLQFVSGVPPTTWNPAMPLSAWWDRLDTGQSATFSFRVTLDQSVYPGQSITNSAGFTYTSLPGAYTTPRSIFNPVSSERTGSTGDPGGTANTYSGTGTASVNVNAPTTTKSLRTTSLSETAGTNLAIGEIVRYRLEIRMAEGTSANLQVLDNLPPGLTFINGEARGIDGGDGSVRAAFVCNSGGACMTSSDPAIASLPVVTGNQTSLASITPTYSLPDEAVSLLAAGNDDAYVSGADPRFKFSTLVNNDRDTDNEYLVIEFNALVDNALASNNQAGAVRVNSAATYIDGFLRNTSNTVNLTVVEPAVIVAKTIYALPDPVDAGGIVTYRLSLSNPVGAATAFDTQALDTLPGELALDIASVSVALNGDASGFTNHSSGNSLEARIAVLPPGSSAEITYSAEIQTGALAGMQIDNTARLAYTSLPGDNGPSPNPTGSITPGSPGADNGERTGSEAGANDYAGSVAADFSMSVPQFDQSMPDPSGYPVGAEVTYNLIVTLPEGTTTGLTIHDLLPAGLEYVPGSMTVIAQAAQGGGLLDRDFIGTLAGFSLNVVGGTDLTASFTTAIVNGNNQSDDNRFLLRFQAVIVNTQANQDGATLTNTASLTFTDPLSGVTTINAPTEPAISVLEPVLQIEKTLVSIDPSPGQVGSRAVYRLTVGHTQASTSAAYDLRLTDALPAALALQTPATVTLSGGGGTASDQSTSDRLDILLSVLPLGETVAVDYTTELTHRLSTQTENAADVLWTSQPGLDLDERGEGDGAPDGMELLDSGALNDYELIDSTSFTVEMDLGDLPAEYRITSTADDGARHLAGGPRLGVSIDLESEGSESATAGGDGPDDDGIALNETEAWAPNGTASFSVMVSGGSGYLAAWFDWNGDLDFDDSHEFRLVGRLSAGLHTVNFAIPANYTPGAPVFSRFRLYPTNPGSTPLPTGLAQGGEAEDYLWNGGEGGTVWNLRADPESNFILVSWTSISELNALGFNLYRSQTPGGPVTKINSTLIPAELSGQNAGQPYSFDDYGVERGVLYYYYLEVVYLSGRSAIEAMASAFIPNHIYLPLVFQEVAVVLDARPKSDWIVLTWVASHDEGYQGYNIYRRQHGSPDPLIRINPALIPIAPGLHPLGQTYTIEDLVVMPGVRYDYFVEIIDANGNAKIVAQDWAKIDPRPPT